jgi:hypothetical protein
MNISFDAVSNFIGAPGGSSKTLAHTCSGLYRVLFVGVNSYNGGSTADTLQGVTYNGTAMTFIDKVSQGGPAEIYLYYLINPDTGTNNIVATTTGTMTELDVMGASYNLTRQTGVPDGSNTGATGASPRTISITTTADNCWLVGVFASDQGSTVSAGTGTTRRSNTGGNLFMIADSNGAKTPPGSFSIQGTVPGGNIAGVAASFAPAPNPNSRNMLLNQAVNRSNTY